MSGIQLYQKWFFSLYSLNQSKSGSKYPFCHVCRKSSLRHYQVPSPAPESHKDLGASGDPGNRQRASSIYCNISYITIILVHVEHRSLGTQGSKPYQGTLPQGVKTPPKMLREGPIEDTRVGQVSFIGDLITSPPYSIQLIKRCISNKMLLLIFNNYYYLQLQKINFKFVCTFCR